jgi:hypothetical protein
MRDVKASDRFIQEGGTELAPMSTTTDIYTAVSYSMSSNSLIFRIVTKNSLQRGADLQWLSAFPAEAEVLYPPLVSLFPPARIKDMFAAFTQGVDAPPSQQQGKQEPFVFLFLSAWEGVCIVFHSETPKSNQ